MFDGDPQFLGYRRAAESSEGQGELRNSSKVLVSRTSDGGCAK